MNKQYIKFVEYFTEEIYKKASMDIKQLYKLQSSNMNELFDIIAKIMLDYNIKDNIMDLTAGQIDLLANKISSSIEQAFSYQNSFENKVINSVLGAAVIDKFYSNIYINSLGISKMNIKNLSDKEIHKIVITKVKGDSWDDRVWNNKHETANILQKEMEEFLKGRTSVNSINKKIKDEFGSNAYNTERLVQYEVARCQNAANELFNKKYGVDQVFYSAALDLKTCTCCSKYDSITYDVSDSQRPKLPQHPFCRCCYISVPYEGWSPKKRKDNITKDIIDYTDYKNWYDKNIEYEKFKNILGKDAPKTLEKYQELKYNNSNRWNSMNDFIKSRESNMISAFTTFDDYEKYKELIDKEVVGLQTSNGIKIKSQSKHFIERVIGTSSDPKTKRPRDGVDIAEIINTLINPLKVKEEPKKNSHKFIGSIVTITINPDTGNLIQCNPTDSDLVRRLKNV